MTHTHNSTEEAEASRSDFQASQGYMRLCLKKKRKKEKEISNKARALKWREFITDVRLVSMNFKTTSYSVFQDREPGGSSARL